MSDHARIEQAAAFWLMRRVEPDWSEGEQLELARWLEQSAAHKAAFWRLEYGYSQLDRLSTLALPSILQPIKGDRLRQVAASGRATVGPVRALLRPMLMAASLAVIFVGGRLLLKESQVTANLTEHATKFGQVGTVELADGSQVELNTETGVRIAQSPTERTLWLERGEAYFEVAYDKKRPFVIHAGSSDVTVLGTKFAVRRNDSRVTVSVLDGRVRLTPAKRPNGESATITAGVIAATDGVSMRVMANEFQQIRSSLAWRYGMAAFDNTTLADAAAQFNRYNRRKLVVSGKDAASVRIGGSFRLDNVEGFARLLERAYGLRVTVFEEEIKISAR